MTYAADTKVPVERSRAEIEKTLIRYGATAFSYGWQGDQAAVMFRAQGRTIRFLLPMPDRDDRAITHTPTKLRRAPAQQEMVYDQAVRARWRALTLVIKAKLEAVEAGIVTFEDEFLSHIVLPDGRAVGEWMHPQLEAAYASGRMPPVLPQLGDGDV